MHRVHTLPKCAHAIKVLAVAPPTHAPDHVVVAVVAQVEGGTAQRACVSLSGLPASGCSGYLLGACAGQQGLSRRAVSRARSLLRGAQVCSIVLIGMPPT